MFIKITNDNNHHLPLYNSTMQPASTEAVIAPILLKNEMK
jgi:hypothetical protein